MRAASTRPTANAPASSASHAIAVCCIPPPIDAASVDDHNQRNAPDRNEVKPAPFRAGRAADCSSRGQYAPADGRYSLNDTHAIFGSETADSGGRASRRGRVARHSTQERNQAAGRGARVGRCLGALARGAPGRRRPRSEVTPGAPAAAAQLGVSAQNGVVVGGVAPGSPAAAAGLRPRDVIIAIDGQPLTEESSLAEMLSQKRPGDTVTLTIIRDRQQQDVAVTLGDAPQPNTL